MTTTTTETITALINQIAEKKQTLKKAYDDLQPLLSPSFPLSWPDIDSHFTTLHSSLSTRLLLLLQSRPEPTPIEPKPITIEPELKTLCENNNGTGLCKYLTNRWNDNDDDSLMNPLALHYAPNPASMILDALEGSYGHNSLIDVRRVFVLLMESFIEINVNNNVEFSIRERAKKLAYEWKTVGKKPFESLLFLHLVAAYGLRDVFGSEELAEYVFMIGKYKQATSVCRKIGLGEERVKGLVKRFLECGKVVVGVKFMYECGVSDGFEPVEVLKSYVKELREAACRVCVEGKYSLKSRNEATDKEVSGLKGVIKVVKDYGIEGEFCEEKLEERVEELEKEKALRKRDKTQQEVQRKEKKRSRIGNGMLVPPVMSQQQQLPRPGGVLMPGVQLNPFGLVNRAFPGGVVVPYMNPLDGLYGSAAAPRPVYYGQQNGFVLPGQYHPPYYSQ